MSRLIIWTNSRRRCLPQGVSGMSRIASRRGAAGAVAFGSASAIGLTALAAVLGACGVDQVLPSGLPATGAGSEPELTAVQGALGSPACLARASNEIRLQAILLLEDAARSNCTAADPCTT